jgi:hypothetical protein
MKDTDVDFKGIIKFMYGLTDYKLPENSSIKAFIFYCTNEEKSVLETNGVYCLKADCTKDEIIDLFNDKVKTYKYLGLHVSDLKLAVFASEDLSIPSIYMMVNPDIEKLFNFAGVNIVPAMFKVDEKAENKIREMILNKLILYKNIAFLKNIIYASVDKDFKITDDSITEILHTKYNIENIFKDDCQIISKMVEDYARSKC